MHNFIITIDQGNTNTTCALFDHGDKLLSLFGFSELEKVISNYNLTSENTQAALSSVVKTKVEVPFKTINIQDYFKENKFIDMPVNYTSTLGIDRLCISYPLYKKDNKAYLCIDCGTFTTVDSIDIKGFNGGYILPGLELLFKSYERGDQLHIPSLRPYSLSLPHSTQEAIDLGAALSFLEPIKSIIEKQDPREVILTGGNSEYLYSFLKESADYNMTLNSDLMHHSLLFIFREVV